MWWCNVPECVSNAGHRVPKPLNLSARYPKPPDATPDRLKCRPRRPTRFACFRPGTLVSLLGQSSVVVSILNPGLSNCARIRNPARRWFGRGFGSAVDREIAGALSIAFQSWLSLRCPSGVSTRIRRALVTGRRLPYRSGDQSVPDSLLPRSLTRPPHGLCFLSCRLLRWLFIEALASHLPEHSFALHLFLQDAKCLIDVVLSDEYLQACCSSAVDGAQMVRNVIERFIRILRCDAA